MLCALNIALVTFVLIALTPTTFAEPVDLNITRIALFSSGVGFFEHEAQVSGDATAALKFRTEQINDIIKSMVVQDFSGGKVGVISYASRDPLEKTLRSFGVDLTGKPALFDLLDQLRGEPVKVSGGRDLAGVIVAVEKKSILGPDGKTAELKEFLTLHTDAGLQRLELDQLQNIALTNAKVSDELTKALATLALAHDADKKTVEVNFEGTGERQVRVAYLLEAPIWKTSYRLVLRDDKKPFLQGWATVDNATEDDWNNVRLSLISGRPISFTMDLYTPLYVPRPEMQLDLYASLRPPKYEGGFAGEEAKMEPFSPRRGGGQAGRLMTRAPMTAAAAPDAAEDAEFDVTQGMGWGELGQTGVQSLAMTEQAGELFAYHIDAPVSIPRQHSAMLPIVNQEIEAEKLSIYNPNTHAKYPLNGLEFKNATKLNLMQGPVTVFDDNVYAGDAKLPDLKPDETRLIAYALDLSTEIMVKSQPTPEELVSVRIAKGTLWHRHKYVDAREYVIKNKADKPRTVILEQPFSDQWTLVQPDKPYERTPDLLRFKVPVAAQETKSYPVKLERLADQSVVLSNVGLDQIQFYLRTKEISPQVREALQKVVELRSALDDAERRLARLEQERRDAIQEQSRIRENLKTLDRSTDAYQRQLKRFDEVDSQITTLASDISTARDEVEKKRQALESYLLNLNVE